MNSDNSYEKSKQRQLIEIQELQKKIIEQTVSKKVAHDSVKETRLNQKEKLSNYPTSQSSICSGKAKANPLNDEVLESLASRIAVRIRHDLARETETEFAKQRERRIKELEQSSSLISEVEGNTCPICFDLMAPPEHSPMILVPCGHTFCSSCIPYIYKQSKAEAHRQNHCPLCRVSITSVAPNRNLQKIIEEYLKAQDRRDNTKLSSAMHSQNSSVNSNTTLSSGESSLSSTAASSSSDLLSQYKSELSSLSIRLSALESEKISRERELKDITESIEIGTHIKTKLEDSLKKAEDELILANKRVEEAKYSLAEHDEKMNMLQEKQNESGYTIDLLKERIDDIKEQKSRILLLLSGMEKK
ncbi:putative Zinc finger protein [Monocercomonoides exilis]|uniref:putative Zinc finger protein n=1 Tax=Monocercomonoides exilis TaxID=2049356 RepID=UPI00355ABEF9|nr:putative Zinc finger protein [Monocercomonoides exilis]|eukprot:MONOS_7102.1-p1 / transcript=MONOS_7102.1 / gene=MONOS_7102 / organism=Monocercomonoides_exilis_PA203 / gene_product=Zinc finger protein / transcript_product=Zinc finger protein / location=Mono_scaffold00236:14039-15448(-) / protein_length=359 / sequence_SO=supercontig / SO=protein_coding / is_pseudo=false